MKAITISESGATPQLTEVPTPTARAGQVLIRATASSVNAVDPGIASGMFEQMGMPHQYPVTLGRDVAGTVEAIGEGVTTVAVGDRVFGEIPFVPPISHGTWAEFVVLDADNVARTPDNVDDATAGAATLAAVTAVQLVDALKLNGGESVLVIGATGGVGSIVVQLLHHAGATVIAPALPEDEAFLLRLGVDTVLPRGSDVVTAVRERYPAGVDAIIDAVTAYQLTNYEDALKAGGQVSSPTNAAGEGVGRTNIMHDPTATILARVAQLLADATMVVPIQHDFDLSEATEAIRVFVGGHTLGKLGLRIT